MAWKSMRMHVKTQIKAWKYSVFQISSFVELHLRPGSSGLTGVRVKKNFILNFNLSRIVTILSLRYLKSLNYQKKGKDKFLYSLNVKKDFKPNIFCHKKKDNSNHFFNPK